MAKNRKLIFVAFFFILCSAKINTINHDKPGWMRMTDLKGKLKSEAKPVMIDLYTNWCYWCKVMDKTTYTNSKVISYINSHFYPVKLNAEDQEVVQWNDKDYNFNDSFKVNDFAMYVTSGQPAFPTTVIFTDAHSEPVAVQGFLTTKEMEPILKYFGEGAYKKQDFTEFKQGFKSTW